MHNVSLTMIQSKPHLYCLIRVRKSGSQSLNQMLSSAFPEKKHFSMPSYPPTADKGIGIYEKFRYHRRVKRRLWKHFKAFSWQKTWDRVNSSASHGDIVSGHFAHGTPQLPNWDLRYITLVRNPLTRLISEYRYCKQSYDRRSRCSRWYLANRLKAAGTGSINDYMAYLLSHGDHFPNPLTAYITGESNHPDPYGFLVKNYFHYGTLEDIETFAKQLSEKIDRPLPVIWTNKTSQAPMVDQQEIDPISLEKLISKDMLLYQRISQENHTK